MSANTVSCPKCCREINQEYFPLGLVFCPYCGEKLGPLSGFEPIPFCPYCGERLLTEVIFCPQCGKRVITQPEKAAESAVVKDIEKPPAAEVPVHEDLVSVLKRGVAEPRVEEICPPKVAKTRRPSAWPKIKQTLAKAVQPINNLLSGQWPMQRLYRKWAKEGILAVEEIPSAQELNQITKEAGGQTYRPLRAVLVALGALAMVGFFIGVGTWITQCA